MEAGEKGYTGEESSYNEVDALEVRPVFLDVADRFVGCELFRER